MAWSLSHTTEAYINARKNIEYLVENDLDRMIEAYTEISLYHAGIEYNTVYFNNLYRDIESFVMSGRLSLDSLASAIADWSLYDYRTTDNGGWNLYICPDGCHTVPFDLIEDRTG